MTLNEPLVVVFEGHIIRAKAPGLRRPLSAMQAGHHLLLGHGLAVQAFRASVGGAAQIGLANFHWPQHPQTQKPVDIAAARRADGMVNRWFLDSVFKGKYPEDIWIWSVAVSQPPEGAELTSMGWEVYPQGLHEMLTRLWREYGPVPLIVTESGAAYPDRIEQDGSIRDFDRIAYLRSHIGEVERAIAEGVDVRGYFVWSLMDNVEWQHGVGPRFGLIHVDYETLRRTWKQSAYWYRDLIRGEAVVGSGVSERGRG